MILFFWILLVFYFFRILLYSFYKLIKKISNEIKKISKACMGTNLVMYKINGPGTVIIDPHSSQVELEVWFWRLYLHLNLKFEN